MNPTEQKRLRELAARCSTLPADVTEAAILAAIEPYRAALECMETTPAKEWRAMRKALLGDG